MKTPNRDPLKFNEKLGYGFGDMASNFFFHTFNLFLLYYYTDVVGLAPAAVGTMFFVVRLFDSFNDPIMGVIADRTETKYGKYRPWLLWMAIPYGLCGVAMFLGPDLSEKGKLVYAYITYASMLVMYTAINIPYSALMGVITPDTRERTVVSSYRFFCAFGGQLLIGFSALPIIKLLGGENEQLGFRLTMGLFAFISIGLFWYTFFATRERVKPPPTQQKNLKQDLVELFGNLPWVILFLAAIFNLANIALRNAVTIHFIKYVVGSDGEPYLWFLDQTTLFFTLGSICMILGVVSTKYLNQHYDKRTLLLVLYTLNAIILGIFFVIPPDQYLLMLVINSLGNLVAGPTVVMVWAMYGDVADYGEWKFGRRATGLVFSGALFAMKFGLTVGGTLSGWFLGWFGFVANEVQSEQSLLGIRLLFSIFPMIFALANALMIYFYPLRDKQMLEIEAEMEKRKAEMEAEQET